MLPSWTIWDFFGHFKTFWDNSKDFGTILEHLDCFPSHFRPFSPIIKIFDKSVTDQPTNQPTNQPTIGQTHPNIEMRGRI